MTRPFAWLLLLAAMAATAVADDPKPAAKPTDAKKTEKKTEKKAEKKAETKTQAKDGKLAFVGGRVLTGTGQVHDPGVILVEDGKITAVGRVGDVEIPKDATRIDAKGHWLCPGFVVVRSSRTAMRSGGKFSDRFDRHHPEAELLHALGITTVYVSGGMSSSRPSRSNAVLRLVRDKRVATVIREPAAVELDYARAKGTKRAALRKLFTDAVAHRKKLAEYTAALEKWQTDLAAWKKRDAARKKKAAEDAKKAAEAAKKAPAKKPEPAKPAAKTPAKTPAAKKPEPKKDTDPEPKAPTKPKASTSVQLALQLIERELPLRARGIRRSDLMRIVDLCREFDLRPIIEDAVEGWAVTPELARVGATAIINPRQRVDPRYTGDRHSGWTIENAHRLERGGVPVTLCPSSMSFGYWGVTGDDLLTYRLTAAFAVRGGMSNAKALAGITSQAAKLLGVEAQVGSLAKGRYADILFMTDDPLYYRSIVDRVYMGGRLQYERTKSTWLKHLKRPKD